MRRERARAEVEHSEEDERAVNRRRERRHVRRRAARRPPLRGSLRSRWLRRRRLFCAGRDCRVVVLRRDDDAHTRCCSVGGRHGREREREVSGAETPHKCPAEGERDERLVLGDGGCVGGRVRAVRLRVRRARLRWRLSLRLRRSSSGRLFRSTRLSCGGGCVVRCRDWRGCPRAEESSKRVPR